MKKTILVVEDHVIDFMMMKRMLVGRGDVDVIRHETLEGCETIFFENLEAIDLVIMDACVPGDEPNSMPLIRKMKKSGFDKPIITASSKESYNQILLDAGATHNGKSKMGAVELALTLLGF
ncbi:hypothetical protein A2442_04120 [Candidatus Campbellbacteria bacterium RIFOXYC2_FULL_35_25]|uniref:Response regulatory domain-containing protein n=1 Tax=Candidatus Campbellbacteria bacterium RIFOXYC2_FULL_35_25 TaxID=1797582 RepID=A0A1F5EJY0_9BACT|nr:MAG: hypothetical protein A2442_04120 [Candidatus Campbellbacteria bacterium RIFOXYC2_FULL_35_25]